MAARSLPEKFVSVDVECVATGKRHDERTPCLVAVVDKDECVLLEKKVKPVEPVVSYLTPLTGLRAGDLEEGESLESVIAEVKALLGPDVVLVGQRAEYVVEWLQLREGVDYKRMEELAELFKTYNPRYRDHNYYSLKHEANTLLHTGAFGLWVGLICACAKVAIALASCRFCHRPARPSNRCQSQRPAVQEILRQLCSPGAG